MLKHVEEWVKNTNGLVIVDGMSLKAKGIYHEAYNVIFNKYGLVVYSDKKHMPQHVARKRQREEHLEAVQESTNKTYKNRTSIQKRTRTQATTKYSSPPTFSPLSGSLSPLAHSTKNANNLGLVFGKKEKLSDAAFSGGSYITDTSRATEENLLDANQIRVTLTPSAMPAPTHFRTMSTKQNSPAQLLLPALCYGEIVTPIQAKLTLS